VERLLGLLALGEDHDPHDLARPVREDDRAADHLVGVAGIDAEADVSLDGGVEADDGGLLHEGDRFGRGVRPGPLDELGGLSVLLAVLSHRGTSRWRPAFRPPPSRGVVARPTAGSVSGLAGDLGCRA